MATHPRQQALDLLSGYSTPSNLLPEVYKESSNKSWYQENVQYRETAKPNIGTNVPSYDRASDTYTLGRRSSLQLDDIAHEASANRTNCGGSLEETANALICIGAGVESQDLAVDGFSNDDPGAWQARLTPALEELDRIIEQDKARTHQQVLDQQIRDQQRVSEERLRETEARVQDIAAEERARKIKEGTHVKGRRRGLPLLLETHGGLQEVMTCYDTGTHDNHMSQAKAIELGYTIDPSPDIEASFQLPNGKIIKAVGHVVVAVQFARHIGSEAASMTCRFNVFERLALPVLIGMTFLQATETITRYTSRMVDLPTTWKRSLRLCAVGSATNRVICTINGRVVSAAADTGSDIALVSGEYALKHGLLRDYSCEELELADGSLEYTSGHADVTVDVPTDEDPYSCRFKDRCKTTTVRFHVLKNLHFNVILDEETIDDLKIFEDGLVQIVAAASNIMPGISTIIRLGSVEASLTQASDKLAEKTKALCTSVQSKFSSVFSKPKSSPVTTTPTTLVGRMNTSIQARITQLSNQMCELEQAENRRLDQIDKMGQSSGIDVHKREYEAKIEQISNKIRNLKASQSP